MAIYGNVAMERMYCSACQCMTLVRQGVKLCCDGESVSIPRSKVRMVQPEAVRKHPSRRAKKEMLEQQGNACIYCERAFGTFVVRKRKTIRLRVAWDHFVPWSYSRNNHDTNFVAACNICNSIKSNLMFVELEEARAYVASRLRVEEA